MPELVAAIDLEKRFGERRALSKVSFTLDRPGVVGVLGPNGAGKTTLLEILEGLSTPTSGSVRLFGERIDERRYPRARVGVVMQREVALDRTNVGEYAALFAAIHRIDDGEQRILDDARLADRRKTPIDRLSGGEAQRLFLAAADVHRPAVLFLDEPTAALDPSEKSRLGAHIHAIGESRLVVMTTHDLREADAICDRWIFLLGGSIKADGPRAELLARLPEGATAEDAFFHFCAARLDRSGALDRDPGEDV